MKNKNIAMLGTGFICDFYTNTLHSQRSGDRVVMSYSRSLDRAEKFAKKWNIRHFTDNLEKAVSHPDIDTIIIGLPNNLHLDAVKASAKAGKAILCTKPLGRTAAEAREMMVAVEKAGVFNGYLEDLVYTHKTLKALNSVKNGALGDRIKNYLAAELLSIWVVTV